MSISITAKAGPVRLAGWGESQDAHHMSAPDPSGRGALAAMQQALDRAGMQPGQVDYINLHGTATAHRLGVLRGRRRLVVNQRRGVAKKRLVQFGGVIGVNPGFWRVWQFRVHWRTSWK